MMELLISFQWEIFIALEVLSFVSLLVFLIIRYTLMNQKLSSVFLALFFVGMILEVMLAVFIYRQTGEISTFTIVIAIFIAYACTFGISDFKRLDRYIKQKIGQWRGINMLTAEEMRKIERAKDPKVIARKNRLWWYAHASVFIIAHYIFWMNFGNYSHDLAYYLVDWSWWEEETAMNAPFQNEMIQQVSKIWMIIFAVDTVVSWSYTFFPEKEK
ncbi:hypothetical protein ACLIBG_09610 [Virgibacillus sp. W0181]|uniref:hypothetical protein n=1 Tax=Virgibacillus sp. W0181 TaxID=3391581 RepID=UPI003F484C40